MFTYANVLTAGRILTDTLDDDKLTITAKCSDITFIHKKVLVTISQGVDRPESDIQITIHTAPEHNTPDLRLVVVLEAVFNADPDIVADIAISTIREICRGNLDGNIMKPHNTRIKKLFSLVHTVRAQLQNDLNFN